MPALSTRSHASFWQHLHHAERSIAAQIKRLKNGPPAWQTSEVERAIPWVEAKLNIGLADSQKAAARLALSSKLLVITREAVPLHHTPGSGQRAVQCNAIEKRRPAAGSLS